MAINDVYDRVKVFDWNHEGPRDGHHYETKYKLPRKTKDPFRTMMRDYLRMEAEKDHRQYGSLGDVLLRQDAPAKAEPRWMELMKPALAMAPYPEYLAQKTMGMLVDTIDNAELQQGYMMQAVDEIRHANQFMYLSRYYARHAPDPAGFDAPPKYRAHNAFFVPARSMFEGFINDDPITCAIHCQVNTETAFTNPFFVGLTNGAAMQGDFATPTVFLSVQSDEARHMANGAATLAAILSDPDNVPLFQEDLNRLFWLAHRFLDTFVGAVADYGQTNRGESYAELWDKWVWDDFGGSYMAKLAPFGVEPPDTMARARSETRWIQHSAAMLGWSLWPLNFWRSDYMTERDFEWFEAKYPGWYDEYGFFWELVRECSDPSTETMPLSILAEQVPALCRVCQMPTLLPRPTQPEGRIVEKGGHYRAFCSDRCEEIYDLTPARYEGFKDFFELWDGWELSEIVRELELVRPDGQTLIGQPHLHADRLWTLADLARFEVVIEDPVRKYAEEARATAG